MTIRARCPHCDEELAFEDTLEGREQECAQCRGGLLVPRMVYYACITCQHRYRSGPHHAGRHFPCRQCGDFVTVPEESLLPHAGRDAAGDGEEAMVGLFGQQVDRSGFDKTHGGESESTMEEWFEDDGVEPLAKAKSPAARARTAATEPELLHAGFLRRLGAAFVDGILLGVASFVLAVVLGVAVVLLTGGEPDATTLQPVGLAANALGTLLHFAYFTVMEASTRQATIGKSVLAIIVIDQDGRRLTYSRAVVRYLGKILSTIPCGLGFLMIGFTRRKQGLHDLIAGTYVVRA